METRYLKEMKNEIRAKGTWSKHELEDKIDGKMDRAIREEQKPIVECVQLYDFVRVSLHGISHPCVIFRMDETCVWGILSSGNSDGCHNIGKIEESRLLKDGWWTNTVICETKQEALKNWMGIFDNPNDVKRAVKLLKEYYKNILK